MSIYCSLSVFVCFIALCTSVLSQNDADAYTGGFQCENRPNGEYAAGDCFAYYYVCLDSERHIAYCPVDTFFNMEIEQCASECVNVQTGEVDGEAEQPCLDFPNGFHPISGACDRYAMCLNDVHFTIACDDDKVFNRAVLRCDDPVNVYGECGDQDLPSLFSCADLPNGLYASYMDCSLYYECYDGLIVAVDRCEPFFRFSIELEQCVPAPAVMECLPPADISIGEQFCALAGRDGLYADPRTCHGSVICLFDDVRAQFHAFSFTCTDPELPDWDDVTKRCVAPRIGCSLLVNEDLE